MGRKVTHLLKSCLKCFRMQHNGVTKDWVLYCRWILYYSQMTIIHCIQGAVSVRFSQSADRILRAAMQTEGNKMITAPAITMCRKDDYFCKYHQLTLNIHYHHQMNTKKTLILIYNFLILLYIGVQFGLLGVNFQTQDFIEANYYLPFHLLEFWAVFILTVLESLILIATGNINTEDWPNTIQGSVLLFNVLSTLTAAIIFSMFPNTYEVPSHYMEYSIQILITLTDFIFIYKSSKTSDNKTYTYIKFGFAISTLCLSVFQILVYAAAFSTGIEAERAAHFCEFSNEIANGCFALWYGFNMYKNYSDELSCYDCKIRDETMANSNNII